MKFKDFVKGELMIIPPFIDMKDCIHQEIVIIMDEIGSCILELISLRVLTKTKLVGIVNRMSTYIDFCMEVLEPMVRIEFSIYYTAVLEWILDESVKEEYFETAENIKRFNEIYYKKILVE